MTEQIEEKIKEIENARKSLDRKVFDLSVRNLINQAIISKSEDSVLKELLQIVVDTIGSERSSMLILDPVEEKLNLKVSVCKNSLEETQNNTTVNEESSLKTVAFAPGEGFAGYALRHRKAVFSNDPENDPRFKKIEKAPKIKNLVSVPLFDEGKVIGVINVSNRDEPFSDEDAQLLQAIADQVAIALQKARLYELAITDGLTGLFIHRYFQMRLESEIARANRNNETIALIMFDIDHFKKFNDTWGHQTGDRVLKMVADTVKQNVREKIDMAARYGGEEFAIIMPDTTLEGAHTFSERLRKAIESKQIIHENSRLTVTISLGCAVFPEHADTREQLICNADIALYNSKSLGRNCVSNYSINLAEKQ
jgi:diguanylate cyclase (GGDEF)-like protein